jgi:hypothetical protein
MMVQTSETLQDATAAAATSMKVYASNNTAATGVTSTTAKNIYIFPAYGASAAGNSSILEQLIATGN